MKQIATIQEGEIRRLLVNIVKEMHPYYEAINPIVFVYRADKKYIDNDIICLRVNYDNFGKITIVDGQLIAIGEGIEKRVYTIEEGIRTLVKSYFRIH